MRQILIILVALLLPPAQLVAAVSFEATVDKLATAYEASIELTLKVTVTDPNVRTSPLPPPQVPAFVLGGSASSVDRSGDTIIRSYAYTLMPQRPGSVTIPPFQVEFRDSLVVDTLSSEPITVTIADPLPVESESGTPTWLYILCLAIIVAGAAWWYRRSAMVAKPELENWRDEYRQRLDETEKLAQREDYQLFSIEAMKLVTALLERQTERKLSGHTTKDLVKLLGESGRSDSEIEQFTELFDFFESVKYSAGSVDAGDGRKTAQRLRKIVELLLN